MGVAALLYLLLLAHPSIQQNAKRIVCYYGSWAAGITRDGDEALTPDKIDPFACTHLIYAFADIMDRVGLIPANDNLDLVNGGFEKMAALKNKNRDLKVLISVGGTDGGALKFSKLTSSFEQRAIFIKSMIKFIREYNFDGIDLDWQFPGQREGYPQDIHSYANLTKELREELELESRFSGKPRPLISMVLPQIPEFLFKGYKLDVISKYVDFFNILGYDYHWSDESTTFHHAPLYAQPKDLLLENNVDSMVNLILKLGLNPGMLNLGIPAFGRIYTLQNEFLTGIASPAVGDGEGGNELGAQSYWRICKMILYERGWTVERPYPTIIGPYMYKGTTWIAFDDEEMIKTKAEYIIKKRLGGVMFWSVDHMDYLGKCGKGTYPLIKAAKEVFSMQWNNTIIEDVPKSVTSKPETKMEDTEQTIENRGIPSSTREVEPLVLNEPEKNIVVNNPKDVYFSNIKVWISHNYYKKA